MTWDVRQTKRFARVYKKLHDNMVDDVDAAIAAVVEEPDIGEKKKGDELAPVSTGHLGLTERA